MDRMRTLYLKMANNNVKVYKDEPQFDFAKLLSVKKFKDLINLKLPEGFKSILLFIYSILEHVLYTAKMAKMSLDNEKVMIDLCVTTRAVYELGMDNWFFSIEERRIPMEEITSVSLSLSSKEFIIHVEEEYDLRLQDEQR